MRFHSRLPGTGLMIRQMEEWDAVGASQLCIDIFASAIRSFIEEPWLPPGAGYQVGIATGAFSLGGRWRRGPSAPVIHG